jgi:hypothetical protein
VGALPPPVTAVPALPVVEPAAPALEDVPPRLAPLVPAVAAGVPAVGVSFGVFSSGASTLHAAPSSSAAVLAKLAYRPKTLIRFFWLFMAYFT